MGRRLALMSDRDHITPWVGANGRETAVLVEGLGVEDDVRMTVDLGTGEDLNLRLTEGLTSLLGYSTHGWKRYRVEKKAGSSSPYTSVEVILG